MDPKTTNEPLHPALAFLCAMLGAAGVGLVTWLAVRESRKLNPWKPTWKDFIKGEWWIDKFGQSMFADQDVGQDGHESIAIDVMLDKEVLIDGLIAYYEAQSEEEAQQYDNESKIEELQELRNNDDVQSSQIYFNEMIPDDVGIAAAGSKRVWEDIENDARKAYAKHEGAIQVVGTNFTAYKVTPGTIKAIQSFILDQAEFEKVDDTDTVIGVEQIEPHKYASIPVAEFLTIKRPIDLWSRS